MIWHLHCSNEDYAIGLIYTVFKKVSHQTHGGNSVKSDRFSKFFHCLIFSCTFALKWSVKMPPHRTRVVTLPCEICVQVIAMLKNRVNKPSRKTQTAMQDFATENYSGKNTSLMM